MPFLSRRICSANDLGYGRSECATTSPTSRRARTSRSQTLRRSCARRLFAQSRATRRPATWCNVDGAAPDRTASSSTISALMVASSPRVVPSSQRMAFTLFSVIVRRRSRSARQVDLPHVISPETPAPVGVAPFLPFLLVSFGLVRSARSGN